jgi:hypothetical protein
MQELTLQESRLRFYLDLTVSLPFLNRILAYLAKAEGLMRLSPLQWIQTEESVCVLVC